MAELIGGLAFCVVALVAFLIRRSYAKKVDAMQATPTVSASDLRPASLPESPIEVKGIIRCDAPLCSEISNSPCVYYTMKVVGRYTVQNGNQTRTHEDTLAERTRTTPFYVEDTTGRVLVRPDGAGFEAVSTINRTQRYDDGLDAIIDGDHPDDPNPVAIQENDRASQAQSPLASLGKMVGNLLVGRRRYTSYQLTESIIAPDAEVYVLGQAHQQGDEVFIGAPAGNVAPFIVSYKSEELLLRQTQRGMFWLAFLGIACAGAGLTLLVMRAVAAMR